MYFDFKFANLNMKLTIRVAKFAEISWQNAHIMCSINWTIGIFIFTIHVADAHIAKIASR